MDRYANRVEVDKSVVVSWIDALSHLLCLVYILAQHLDEVLLADLKHDHTNDEVCAPPHSVRVQKL